MRIGFALGAAHGTESAWGCDARCGFGCHGRFSGSSRAKLADVSASQVRSKALAQPEKDWISTQEAANRCGFSRPFVAALLDSGTYAGKVHRTAGGHRKVLANEFEALVAKASAIATKTSAQARKAVDLRALDDVPATPRKARKQSKLRAGALAKKLGLAA